MRYESENKSELIQRMADTIIERHKTGKEAGIPVVRRSRDDLS
jgi:hypothetical protein